ncbi:cytochrome P450, family 79, subfamily B, polypeptide 2 [Hibiscus trionum]|uniref:Cytochrome P450, family 79, subfamily B, polypeptide 2 n=2 Tax=Hibiscus trionum TaxID=183268 RepID=A0A9W7MEE1_HIBTR|nr:cytochrome P450, family 79, subfamily B, polypeptide 2 [Hibiscus trionum]
MGINLWMAQLHFHFAMEIYHPMSIAPFTTMQSFPTFFVFITFACLCYLFKSQWQGKVHKGRKPWLPPGPKPWPIVGHLPQFIISKKTTSVSHWIHSFMKEMNTEIGCIRLGNVHVIPVTCPEIGLEFLKKQDSVFASRPLTMATDVLSKGHLTTIFSPFGDQWKKMKRVMVSEVLSPARHRLLYEKRVEEADNLVRYVHNQCKDSDEGGLVNLRVVAQHYCSNVTRKLIFNRRYFGEGKPDGGPGFEEEEYVEAIFAFIVHLYSFCVSDYLPFLRGLDLEGHEKIVEEAIRVMEKYQDPIIEDRVQQWRNGKKLEPQDLLDVLVSLTDDHGAPLLSTNEIKAQISEINVAAVDNPSNALEWAFAEMLNKPETLQKAMNELDNVVGRDRLVQESDFPKLNYVKACAREAFRLHPISPFNPPHVSVSDTTVAGYFIPKGSHVILSRFGLGRNPKVWDEPSEFKPERHLRDCNEGKEVVLAKPELRLFTFSRGRRGCSGVVLGSSMTTMMFARLLHSFEWSIPASQGTIDLSQGKGVPFLAKPLLAVAKPRLPPNVYSFPW